MAAQKVPPTKAIAVAGEFDKRSFRKTLIRSAKPSAKLHRRPKRVQAATIDYHARQTRSGRVYVELLKAIRAATPANVILSYVGPPVDDQVAAAPGGGGNALGSWAFEGEPVRDLVISGEYDKAAYPEVPVPTINDAWLKKR